MPPMPPMPPPGIGGVFSFQGSPFFSFLPLPVPRAPIDHCTAAWVFRQPLLQFFFVVITVLLFNLPAVLRAGALDIGLFAPAFDNGGVFFVDCDSLRFPQFFELV